MNLNDQLQPVDSPIANYSGAVTAFEFDNANERNTVDLTKIKNFSFNQGQGGTLGLGGTANGNGLMVVKDASGSTIATINNSGITITGGNISVQNSAGTTILDATGLISTANFHSDGTSDFNNNATTSSTYVDLPGGTLNPFTLTRDTKIMIAFDVYGYNGAAKTNGAVTELTLNDGTAVIAILISSGIPYNSGVIPAFSGKSLITTLGAGTHTIGMQWKTDAGGTAHAASFDINYVILGN